MGINSPRGVNGTKNVMLSITKKTYFHNEFTFMKIIANDVVINIIAKYAEIIVRQCLLVPYKNDIINNDKIKRTVKIRLTA